MPISPLEVKHEKQRYCRLSTSGRWRCRTDSKKQFEALKLLNSETINLYWEIGEERDKLTYSLNR